MKRLSYAATLFAALSFSGFAYGQVTGVQTVPGSFPTIAAAVTALNAAGVGAGGATINVAAGYTETPTAPLVLTMSVNGPTPANPLVIQKSGAGSNPLITAFTPGVSTTLDGIFIINGADYVTINGIDLQENAANTTATMQMEWGYALLKSSAANGSQYNTIKNCTVTLNKTNLASVGIYIGNHTTASTTALTVTTVTGTSSFNKFYNNTVQNTYNGYSFTGYGSAAPYDFYDQGNQVGRDGVSTNRSLVTNFGGGANGANGIVATNQNAIRIFSTNINGGTGTTSTLNGISLLTGTNSNVDVYNDTVTLTSASTGSLMVGINNGMGGTGAGSVVNIYGNVVTGCTMASATSAEFRGIAATSTASYTNIYSNTISNNTLPGTGQFSAVYCTGGSVTLCLELNIYSNTISNNSKTGTGGVFNCVYANFTSVVTKCYNNVMTNNTATTTSGQVYGYYNFSVGIAEMIYDNQINTLTGGTGDVIALNANVGPTATPADKTIYGNTISGISGAAIVGAILCDYGGVINMYKNNIFNVSTSSATQTVYGIKFDNVSSFNWSATIYNNFISDVKAPSSTSTAGVYGMWIQGTANSNYGIYNNTIFLNAVSASATTFGTAGVFLNSVPLNIDFRNNIVVNLSTPGPSGGNTVALQRNTTTLTNYSTNSGNNCLYAGTPAANRLIYNDGTNSDQTIQAYKNRVTPREQASFTEMPPFINTATTPYNLHLAAGSPTECESGGNTVSAVTVDYDGQARYPNAGFPTAGFAMAPDVGADEIGGNFNDIASPLIQYTPLTNSAVAANRPCPTFAAIFDPSGINNTPGTRPRIYYKRSTNANTFNTNTNATDGWKFVEASNAVSPFSFTIDYSLLFGGGVVAGDIIQYFVVAQDLNGTPRVGINSGAFTTAPTSVVLAAANFPLTSTINQYTIVAAPLSGTINVGPTEIITSLTNAGGIFQAINNATLSGNLIINITGDLTAETGTVPLNQWAEEGAGNYTVTIQPSAAVTRNIYGSSAAASLIRFDGADRVNIDGRFAGTGTYLMFRNTSNAAPTIGYLNDAQNNTVQYTIVESGNTSTSTTLGGAIWIGTTTGLNGNDNITISNCEIRDRSDVAGTSPIAINCVGTNTAVGRYNNNCVISNNNIHDWFLLNSGAQFAINIGTGCSGFTINGNSFYQTATRTHTVAGAVTRAINISFTSTAATNGGFTINNNFIGGSAPGATGSDMVLTVSGAGVSQTFGAISVITGLIPNSLQGNTIRKIDFTTNAPAAAATIWFGFNFGQGYHNIGTTTGNTIGDGATTGSLKITVNSGGAVNSFIAGFLVAPVNGSASVQNNTIAGITLSGTTTTGGIIPQWIQVQGTPSTPFTITGNTIGSTTTANSIQNNALGAPCVQFSIRQITSTGAAANISNNTIQNVTDNSTNASSVMYGALLISTTGSTGTLTVNGNTIRDLSLAGGATTPVLGLLGISLQGFGGTTHSFNDNIIAGLSCSGTGALQNYAVGIQSQGSSTGGTMNRNRIFDIRNSNTGANPGTVGIYLSAGLNWTMANNMISITNGSNTNTVDMAGIVDVMAQNSVLNLYYNSIYLAGSVSAGALNSGCYGHLGNSTVTLRDNLLYNKRTGGTGFHVAVVNSSGTPTIGWGATSSNYNAFVVSDTTKVGVWQVTAQNMSGWRAVSGGDMNSIWQTTTTVATPALFVNVNAGNLHINTSTYPEALGTPVAGITTDFDGNPRSASFPTIGADELACSAIVFSVSAQTNVTCNGGNNGSASVAGTGGNGITYSWAPSGGTAATATGLTAGTYTVTINNICGSSGTVSVTITQPPVLTATVSSTNVTCNGANNGSASVGPTGGTPGYTFSWAPSGGTGIMAVGLAPGSYTCTITDANLCTTTQSVTITQPAVLVASPVSQTNVSCNGGATGAATVMATGGNGGNTYSWTPSGGNAATATGLIAGSYTVNVTDINGCAASQTFSITEPTALSASSMQTNVSCNGGTNGDAMVMVSGGTPGYTYSWAPSGGTNATASSLAAGTYTCTVTDANLCTMTQSFNITEPSALSASAMQTNVSCNGGTNGDAMVMVSGGTGGYTYSWSPSGGTAATATGLAAGTYTVTITDANSCTMTQSFNITEPAVLTASVTTATDPTTCGGSDGAIDISVSGGTTAYTFAWSSGPTTEDVTGLAAGTYSVSITDANGCGTTLTGITLTDPAPPTVTYAEPIDTACQTTTAPFTLTGESPAGGTWSGPGVSGNTFDPMNASIGYNVITYDYTDPSTGCAASATDSIWVDICSGITVTGTNSWNVYPNPTTGSFTIESSLLHDGMLKVEIYAVDGRLVSSENSEVKAGTAYRSFDLTAQPVGVYTVRIIQDEHVVTVRLIKN